MLLLARSSLVKLNASLQSKLYLCKANYILAKPSASLHSKLHSFKACMKREFSKYLRDKKVYEPLYYADQNIANVQVNTYVHILI